VSAADGLYVVERDADGVLVEAAVSTAGHLEARITFDGAPAARLGGLDLLDKLLEHGATACAVMMAGVCERALQLTADYTKTRVQFERPIASFQAVSQRAADAYIDTEAVRLTAWQAAWRLHEGLPSAEQVATAKYWASEGGQRVVAAAHHLHGGMGVDRDYPLHRCFLWAKQLELSLGSAMPSLVRLGKLLAAAPG
jgi:alkylation response protein AidB-like acyl-CoA dehydrogenase